MTNFRAPGGAASLHLPIGGQTGLSDPDPPADRPVTPLIGDQRCYGESPVGIGRGYGGMGER